MLEKDGVKIMKNHFIILITALLLSSCAFAPSFKPTTIEGAQCKQQCAENMQRCSGSSYTCDKSYAKCVEACVDTERVIKMQNSK